MSIFQHAAAQRTNRCLIAAALVLTLGFLPAARAAPPAAAETRGASVFYLGDRVRPRTGHPGMLKASDVCLRSLRPRPVNDADPHDTLQAIRDFHVTRLEWTYGLTADFIKKVQALGCTASGACANASLAGIRREGSEWYKRYSVLDLNGDAVEAPWMRAWPGHALWHCVNNPAAREGYLNYVKAQIDQGVRDLQRDDPTMNYHATRWGGCFCAHCIAGFQQYLQAHASRDVLQTYGIENAATFDYADHLRKQGAPAGDAFVHYPEDELKRLFITFQQESTIAFHRWWRQQLDDYAGRHVPVSSNNGASDFGPIHSLFDFYIGELSYSRAQPETLYDIARQVESLGKAQTVTMPLRHEAEETRAWIDTTRRTIATVYGLGMHIEAPWDTYLPVRGAVHPPRYFGDPADYADLFALVRGAAELLDGYVSAAACGGIIADDRWTPDTAPVAVFSASPRVFAATRARPADREAPIVVHLVDWSTDAQPFTVSFNPAALFGGRPLRLSLIRPRPYDRQAHAAAFQSGDYGPLVEEVPLASGRVTTCELPRLRPWGLLVVRPLPDTDALWAPRFFLSDHQGAPAIRVASPDRDVTLRYTTDGSQPTDDSPVFRDPIPLADCRQVRARSDRGGEVSPVSVVRHLPAAGKGARTLDINGDFSRGTAQWRPVVARELADRDALDFAVDKAPELGGRPAARLRVRASDGIPYHLRLVQPVPVPAQANLYLTATLRADRPTRVRLGIQERPAPYRVVRVGVLELGTEPRHVRLSMINPHPDLHAQIQLDLGYCAAGTTVWLSDVKLNLLAE